VVVIISNKWCCNLSTFWDALICKELQCRATETCGLNRALGWCPPQLTKNRPPIRLRLTANPKKTKRKLLLRNKLVPPMLAKKLLRRPLSAALETTRKFSTLKLGKKPLCRWEKKSREMSAKITALPQRIKPNNLPRMRLPCTISLN